MNVFRIGRNLLLEKWKNNKQVSKCFNDFFKVWGTEANQNWFEGFHPSLTVPSQDNALESTNKYMKDKGTLRKRLPISQFVELIKNRIVKDWSTDRNPLIMYNDELVDNLNCKKFHMEPVIELADWTAAYQLSKLGYPSGSNTYYYSTTDKILHKQRIKDWIAVDLNGITGFDELITHRKSMRVLEFNLENWKLSKCNCSWFLKNYLCRHMIILATILLPTSVKFPDSAKQIEIGQNRKRGRPANPAPALQRQPDELDSAR